MHDNKLFKRKRRVEYPQEQSPPNKNKQAIQRAAQRIESQYAYIHRIHTGLKNTPGLPETEITRIKNILERKIQELW